jgi:hypothetical protein
MELCGSTENLKVYELLPGQKKRSSRRSIMTCAICKDQIENPGKRRFEPLEMLER